MNDNPGRYDCGKGHSVEVGSECDICAWNLEQVDKPSKDSARWQPDNNEE